MAEHAQPVAKTAGPAQAEPDRVARERGLRHKSLEERPDQQALASAERMLNGRPALAVQRAAAEALSRRPPAGPRPVQRKAPLPLPNLTGMPNRLKSGIEALSGVAMGDVRVHRNSAEPAKLGALAFAKGSDIHLGPGQEQHLPHEAWHVVQQKQGRVGATMQLRGEAINDDQGLEAEADAMGTRALGLALSGDAPPPTAPSAVRGNAVGPIQRTTIVIGYQEGDTMFNASLNEIDKPHPVYYFSNKGEPLPEGPESNVGLELKKGEDKTRIHVVAHGSPGKLASVNLPAFLEKIRELGLFTKDVTDMRLGVCYTMMREDIDDQSVAFTIAQWLQKHADTEIDQQVKLVAGYTSNTGGEFAKGNASFEPLDTRSAIEAQHFGLYLFYKTKAMLVQARLYEQDMFDDLWSDCEGAEDEVAEAIIAIAPDKPGKVRNRQMGSEFAVSSKGIEEEDPDDPLDSGYVIASVTKTNFDDFPIRLIDLEDLSSVEEEVIAVLKAAVDKLYEEYAAKASVRTSGFSTDLGSKPDSQSTFTFGFTPSFGSQSQQSTNFTFTPTFGSMPTFGSQGEGSSNIGFTPTFGSTTETSVKKEEKK